MFEKLNLLAIDWSLGINVTICGIVIVFAMLILLVIILTLSGSIFGAASKKTKAEKKSREKVVPVKTAAPVISAPVAADGDEIIAVIAAAVASMYEGTNVRPVIRAVKRSGGPVRPAWTAAGIYENTRAF